MRSRPAAALLALVAITPAMGCVSHGRLTFSPPALARLDGFRVGQTVELEADDGNVVPFTRKTTLWLESARGPDRKLRCEAIDVRGSTLTCLGRTGLREYIDLSESRGAYVKTRSGSNTLLYVVLGLVALSLVCAAAGCSDARE